MGRTKKEKDYNLNSEELIYKEEEPIEKEAVKNEFGTITLVAKNKIFYDYNGESRCKFGHFNVKVGDRVEV